MKRIAIVGCSGGGKSTLACRIGERLALPVIHLDALFWLPGWKESEPADFQAALDAAVAAEHWVSDGNFISHSQLRFERADTIIWLELPMLLCLWRAVWRAISAFGRSRADLAPGCPEKIDLAFYGYIWSWNRLKRPQLQRTLATHAAHAKVIRLSDDRAVTAFLSGL